MNKEQLMDVYTTYCSYFGLQPKHVLVGAGGAMLIHGLRQVTADVDVSVPASVFSLLRREGAVSHYFTRPDGVKVEVLTHPKFPEVDAHMQSSNEVGMMVDGVYIYTLEYLLEFKLMLNRDRDQDDIKILRTALEK